LEDAVHTDKLFVYSPSKINSIFDWRIYRLLPK
jgi:hypothetical protein